ncbi:MAG: tetratricopeptide repeat protein, partial [Nitrosopumilus sp.]|nr:tetratricopeptide repeat protein [Nitrosopumilus sp.]
YKKSIEMLDNAIQLDLDNAIALNEKGQVYLDIEEYALARDIFTDVLELDEKDISALLGMAELNFLENKNIKAEQFYDKVLSLDPDNLEGLLGKANVLQNLGRSDDALRYFDEALEVDPDNLEASSGRDSVLENEVSTSLDLILIITIIGSITSVFSFVVVMIKIKENKILHERVLIADEQIEDLVDKFMKRQQKPKND